MNTELGKTIKWVRKTAQTLWLGHYLKRQRLKKKKKTKIKKSLQSIYDF